MLKHIENCYAMSWLGLEIDGLGEEAVHVGFQGFQEPHILVGLLSVILAKACRKEISTYFNTFLSPNYITFQESESVVFACFCMFLHVLVIHFPSSQAQCPAQFPRFLASTSFCSRAKGDT
jgi:hypothetical protein